jgi:uncharacterized damage-inducible protein DinB
MVLDCFNQVDLSHIPFTGSWSVGEIALHIANAEDGWFGTIARKAYDKWPESQNMVNYPNIKSIKSLLSETHSKTMAFLETLSLDDLDTVYDSDWGKFSLRFIIWHVMEHEIHHRGELSLILGTLGREGLDV